MMFEDQAGDECRVVVHNTFVSVVTIPEAVKESRKRCSTEPCSWRHGDDDFDGLSEAETESRCGQSSASSSSEDASSVAASADEEQLMSASSSIADAGSSSAEEKPDSFAAFDMVSAQQENERLAKQNAALLQLLQQQSAEKCFQQAQLQAAGVYGFGSMWLPSEMVQRTSLCPHAKPWRAGDAETREGSENAHTTVMLRNLPNNYTRAMLIEMLETEGFGDAYDFLYLPIDFRKQAALGYAFVNLLDSDIVQRFWNHFEGFANWAIPSKKTCFVSWCEPDQQGLQAHIDRYRNSPVMHPSVPDEYKPVLVKHGQRIVFPKPTKSIRVPRARNCRLDHR